MEKTGIPPNPYEAMDVLYNDVLQDIELRPEESKKLLEYLNERHEYLYGPHKRYFILGSYERPFKFRLEEVADELNHRHNAYAYLMGPLQDPDLPDDFPTLKLKFYLHAMYADYIALVLEHNTGGALAEFGRVEDKMFFNRTHVYPRAYKNQYEEVIESLDAEAIDDPQVAEVHEDVKARAIEIAYETDEDVDQKLAALVDELNTEIYTVDALKEFLEEELGDHIPPTYTGVLTDGFIHFERAGRCHSWVKVEELRQATKDLP